MQMQDIHSVGGGSRFFGGVGDRRLRPHHHNNQAINCPRCDSPNTKFCYYNNYNLSQPRHFCKSCRRYWTKGGVLRNVPVGGGCRKTKRSKPKQPAAAAASPPSLQEDVHHSLNSNDKTSNSHSTTESESESLTATNTTTKTNTIIEAVSSKPTAPTNSNSSMFSGRIEVETSKLFSTNPSFEQAIYEQYPDIGSFVGLMPMSSSENMPLGFGNMMNQQTMLVQVEQQQSLWEGGCDENEMKRMQNGGSRGGESGGDLNWQGSGDQGLFHIPNAVDQVYWTDNQWSANQDHPPLYLP